MAVKGGTSVTHSFSRPPAASQSVDSRPTKCSICCKSEKGAGLFQAQALFKGGLIFDVDMYLDFTAKFDTPQPHPSPPPSVAAAHWSRLFSPWCGAAPAVLVLGQRESTWDLQPHQTALTLNCQCLWTGMSACQNIAFHCHENRHTSKVLGLLPGGRERVTVAAVALNRMVAQRRPKCRFLVH